MLLFSFDNLKVHGDTPVHWPPCLAGTSGPGLRTTALPWVPAWAVLGAASSPLWSKSAQCQALRWVAGLTVNLEEAASSYPLLEE